MSGNEINVYVNQTCFSLEVGWEEALSKQEEDLGSYGDGLGKADDGFE